MKVGVIIPNAGSKATVENIQTTSKWAKELGYHSLWLTDHVVLAEEVNALYPYRSHLAHHNRDQGLLLIESFLSNLESVLF